MHTTNYDQAINTHHNMEGYEQKANSWKRKYKSYKNESMNQA